MPLINNAVTRFPGGMNNLDANNIFNALQVQDETIYISLFNDFQVFTVAQWSVGGVNTPTRAQQAGLGGLVRLATSAASGDNSWMQTINPTFQITAGKPIFFRARLAVDAIALATSVVGLQIAVAANNFLTPVNGIFFRKAAGVSSWELVSRAASVETTSGPIATGADNVFVTLSFYYDGGTDLYGAVNSSMARITPAALPSVLMAATVGVQAASAVVRNLDLDLLYTQQQR